jgi:hypothetical protein
LGRCSARAGLLGLQIGAPKRPPLPTAFPHRKNRARTPLPLCPTTVPQASLLLRGPSPRCADSVLPLPSTGGPLEIATTGQIGPEKERAAASPSRHLPRSKTTPGELPASSQSYVKKPQ